MKTSQATINLVLNKQRINKQGLMPVVLRVAWAKKRATKQTGIYVNEKQWDSKSQQIRTVVENYGTLNQRLFEIKSEAIRRLNALVASGRSYTARHTFATHFVLAGGNPIHLAELMGRSVNGIFRYVSGLTSAEQNIKERSRVFGKK